MHIDEQKSEALCSGLPPTAVELSARKARRLWIPVATWSIIGVCMAAMVFTAGTAAIEHYIRQRTAEGVAAALQGSASQIDQSLPQQSFASDSRNLQSYQMKILMREIPNLLSRLKSITIGTAPTDTESFGLYGELSRIFQSSGITLRSVFISPRDSQDEGLLIWVENIENIPEAAEQLREALEIANLHPTITNGPPGYVGSGRDFVFFIAPTPIR